MRQWCQKSMAPISQAIFSCKILKKMQKRELKHTDLPHHYCEGAGTETQQGVLNEIQGGPVMTWFSPNYSQ